MGQSSGRCGSAILAWLTLSSLAYTPSQSKCSFVTVLLSEDFLHCSVAWLRSLRRGATAHEVTVLVLPEISPDARARLLQAGADQVVTTQEIENPNAVVQYQAFAKNYAILRVWQLGSLTGKDFQKAVYMDSDMIVTQNSDHLCQRPELSAARDLGAQGEDGLHSEEFNAGLMVLEPNEATFQRLVDLAPQVRSSSGGVQPLLRAAFPDFHPLDHWRDNVNARLFDLSRAEWHVEKIRSIHYTGPLKPCFTFASDFAAEEWEQPMRIWHRANGEARDPPFAKEQAPCQRTWASSNEAWRTWFPVPQDSVLQHLFGVGEEELLSLGASHVCKHLSAAMAKFAEQVFAAGYQQLVSCQGGSCSQIPLVEEELTRAGDQLQRTWQIFLQRASNDAKVELYGLGSVEDVLLDQRRKALELLEQSLREIHHARQSLVQDGCVFDMTTRLARALRDQEQLMRWHLSHALLALFWWQLRQQREQGHFEAPPELRFELPGLRFEDICCRRWDVVLAALERTGGSVAAWGGAPDLQEWLPGLEQLEHLPGAGSVQHDVVLLGCGGPELEPLEEFLLLREQLQRLESSKAQVMGCHFLAKHIGLVEAVSQHALEAAVTLNLGVDGTWWF